MPRRMPQERSYRERKDKDAGCDKGEATDVARILACMFCVVPPGARQEGLVVPFFYVRWMRYFDWTTGMQVAQGDRAGLRRCARMLEEWGVEGIQRDPHELPYCMPVDEVAGLCYTQKGYHTPRAGPPDFHFVDTMWEKLK